MKSWAVFRSRLFITGMQEKDIKGLELVYKSFLWVFIMMFILLILW